MPLQNGDLRLWVTFQQLHRDVQQMRELNPCVPLHPESPHPVSALEFDFHGEWNYRIMPHERISS